MCTHSLFKYPAYNMIISIIYQQFWHYEHNNSDKFLIKYVLLFYSRIYNSFICMYLSFIAHAFKTSTKELREGE